MLEQLQKHLALLRRRGLITEWYDRDIDAGERWRDEILRELEAADLILLLVSADFLASDFCYEEETLRAIERADRGEAKVIAVMLRPVDGWETTQFAQLQVVPRDARPITTWANADEAWSNVAAEVRAAVEKRARDDLPEELAPSQAELRLGEQVAGGSSADTDPATVARADELAQALEELLRQPEGEPTDNPFVIVEADSERNYFTQYLGTPQGLWCEAVSNENLDPANALSDEQMSRLVAFGWNSPQGDLPNWWYEPDASSEPGDVAWLSVQTLAQVYGVALGDPFEIVRSWA
jgi:type III secretion system-like peptide-binding chaperone/TIR domain-containing protein